MSSKNKKTTIVVSGVWKKFYQQKDKTLKELLPSILLKKQPITTFWALEDVSLRIKKGEVLGIIGSNGSGKSTLLKLIAGVSKPNMGSVQTTGRVIPLIELGAGFHPELTGKENIFLNGIILGMTRKEINQEYEKIVAFSELATAINQPVKHYSSGMYIRLAFSVAVHLKPDIVLIDEILSVGDEYFQRKSLRKIKEIIEQKTTVVIVSHSLDLLAELCDSILWLEKSRVVKVGPASDVVAAYRASSLDQHKKGVSKKTTQHQQFQVWGNVKATIHSVTLLSAITQQETAFFEHLETIQVQIEYRNPKKLPLNVAVGLYTENDTYVTGVSTVMDSVKIKPQTIGTLQLSFSSIPLTQGRFYLRVALFGEIETDPYHFWHKTNWFEVATANRKNRGLLSLPHQWKSQP